jgi:hypothetical protein
MSATIYNCTATVVDHEGEPMFTKNVFAFRKLLTALGRVNNDILPRSEDKTLVNDFRKEQKISKQLSNTILLQYLTGTINDAKVSVDMV